MSGSRNKDPDVPWTSSCTPASTLPGSQLVSSLTGSLVCGHIALETSRTDLQQPCHWTRCLILSHKDPMEDL